MAGGIAGLTAEALHTAMLLGGANLERPCSGRRAGGDVYCAILRVSANSRAALARWTHPDDARTVQREDRRLARALLRAMLCTLTGTSPQRWTFRHDAHGRPVAVDVCGRRPPFLAIAHSHGWLACIVSGNHPAGVDIETFRPGRSWREIAQMAFGPLEQAHALRGPDAFLRVWTAREALAKAADKGFALVADRADYVPALPAASGPHPVQVLPDACAASIRSCAGVLPCCLRDTRRAACSLAVAARKPRSGGRRGARMRRRVDFAVAGFMKSAP